MNSEFIYIQGKGSWVRVVNPDQWDCWSVTIHPNSEGLEIIRDLQAQGMKNTLKKDDDGYYTKFRRPVTKKTMKGKIRTFAPPGVVDKDGKPMDGTTIGNGSDLTLKIEVYEHGTPGGGKAKAARLESVRVDNLIKFERTRDFNDDEKAATDGLVDQPEQLF